AGEVARHEVDAVGQVLPRAGNALHIRLAAQPAFGADLAGHARDLGGERAELVHHRVDDVFDLQNFAADIDSDLLRQVTRGDGGRHFRHVAELHGEVAGHGVDAVGQVLPRTGHAFDIGL